MYRHERSLVTKYVDQPFVLLGVNGDQVSVAKKVQSRGTVTWRSFQNKGGTEPISEALGVRVWPTLFVIDQEGIIRAINKKGAALETAIDETLAAVEAGL